MAETPFDHGTVELHRDQKLGVGSYGEVFRATCGVLPCAGKIVHINLVSSEDPGATKQLEMFEKECRVLSLIRHPNIVQYLATHKDPISNLPVLLMELCDESLTHFLERSEQPLLYRTEVEICSDVALALAYLHANNIVHRDLTSNNVLLAGRRAKVTDLGMYKFISQATKLTRCPGNPQYMSPEALMDSAVYTDKLDCFSWGVLTIQVMTRQFPSPGPTHQEIPDLKSSVGVKHIPIPDEERRKSHIDLVPNHPMLTLAKKCLRYKAVDRPSAGEICKKLAELKKSSEYCKGLLPVDPDSGRQEILDLNRKVEDLSKKLKTAGEKLEQTAAQLEEKNKQQQESKGELQQKEIMIRVREEQLERMSVSLGTQVTLFKAKEEEVEQMERKHQEGTKKLEKTIIDLQLLVADLQHRISDEARQAKQRQMMQSALVPDHNPPAPTSGIKRAVTDISCRPGKTAPEEMSRGAAAVHGDIAYFRPAGSKVIYTYQSSSGKEEWSSLSECPFSSCSLAVIGGVLTTVGGYGNGYTNVLLCLRMRKRWFKQFPVMPTPRSVSAVACSDNELVVAGGQSEAGNLDVVEIMNLETKQWLSASCVPHPIAIASAAICNSRLYLAGGYDESRNSCKCVLVCSLSEPREWIKALDISLSRCALVNLSSNLIAVGGEDDRNRPSKLIQQYDPNTNVWKGIGYMGTGRSDCLVAALTSGKLLIAGGFAMDMEHKTDSVEVGTPSYRVC